MPRRYDLELFLKRAEVFESLNPADRKYLVSMSHERTYSKGETIFHEGHPSKSVWLMLQGRVHLLHYLAQGRVQTTCVMTPGESFCCLPALDRGTYPATAVAATRAAILQTPTTVFHEMMGKSPTLFQDALCSFCSRLRQVEAKGCLAHDPVERRIAQALLTLQKKFGDSIPMTKQEISEIVGTTVETTIRTLSRFQREGSVRSARGKIQLLKPDRLNQLLR